jgi:hypothetical protein
MRLRSSIKSAIWEVSEKVEGKIALIIIINQRGEFVKGSFLPNHQAAQAGTADLFDCLAIPATAV